MENFSRPRFTAIEKGKAPASENPRVNVKNCENCTADQSPGSAFCRHCSCDICGKYDVNKDPSLWIACMPDDASYDSCRKNLHVKCALKSECIGVPATGPFMPREVSLWCTTCGNISDIIGCVKQQLRTARDAQGVDEFCHRLSLSYRLLVHTQKYKSVFDFVEEAKGKLEKVMGPIDQGPGGRVTVRILSFTRILQNYCNEALTALQTIRNEEPNSRVREGGPPSACRILPTEDASIPGFVLYLHHSPAKAMESASRFHVYCWQYKTEDPPSKPLASFAPNVKTLKLSNLQPLAEYAFRIVTMAEKASKCLILGICEIKCLLKVAAGNPCPPVAINHGEEPPSPEHNYHEIYVPVVTEYPRETGHTLAADCSQPNQATHMLNQNATPLPDLNEVLTPPSESPLVEDGNDTVDTSRVIKKNGNQGPHNYVQIITWLAKEGHIPHPFKLTFISWFGLRATEKEKQVVYTYFENLSDDGQSLGEQLVHSFADIIY